MKNGWIYSMLLCSVFSLTVSESALAKETEEQSKFEIKVGLGVMFIDSGNNLNPDGSKANLSDLDSAAEQESTETFFILPEITYDIGDQDGMKLYFNTTPATDEVGGFALSLGGYYPIEGIGIIDISSFFNPFEEAWENPYSTGVDRKKTDTSKFGTKIAFNKILGTGLRVNAVYMKDDVDEDVIGTIMPDLSRDGAVYVLNTSYSFYLSQKLEIRPRVSIRKGEYDGVSNSFTKVKMDLETRYMVGRLALISRIFYSCSEYDEINQIFKKTREDDGYGISLMANFSAPFGMENWSTQMIAGYSIGDSNINFYDTESTNLGFMLTYHF